MASDRAITVNPGPGALVPYTATQLGHPGMSWDAQQVLSGKGQSVAVLDLPAYMTVNFP